MFAPYVLIEGQSSLSLLQAAAAADLRPGLVFYFSNLAARHLSCSGARWLRQAGIVLLATLAARILIMRVLYSANISEIASWAGSGTMPRFNPRTS
jgi:hypothetical protein